jgi:5-dehydro-2-deoxygluconokinase
MSSSAVLDSTSSLELLTVGRVNLDLYAREVGVPFTHVASWDAMVGGSPANVALAASRLGIRAGLFSAVGDDLVGDWVIRALQQEAVNTAAVHRRHGPHTSLAMRAQLAPDHPLIFYRQDPADIHLTVAEAQQLPLGGLRALLVSIDSLARGTTAEAGKWILRRAQTLTKPVYIDLDLRRGSWVDIDTYAAAVWEAFQYADVVLGTTEEFCAWLQLAPDDAQAIFQVLSTLASQSPRVFVLKRGSRGATLYLGSDPIRIAGERVREASSVGAGDSFAAGLIAARLRGCDWTESIRVANACAAITVTRFGCSRGFPRLNEVEWRDPQSRPEGSHV